MSRATLEMTSGHQSSFTNKNVKGVSCPALMGATKQKGEWGRRHTHRVMKRSLINQHKWKYLCRCAGLLSFFSCTNVVQSSSEWQEHICFLCVLIKPYSFPEVLCFFWLSPDPSVACGLHVSVTLTWLSEMHLPLTCPNNCAVLGELLWKDSFVRYYFTLEEIGLQQSYHREKSSLVN